MTSAITLHEKYVSFFLKLTPFVHLMSYPTAWPGQRGVESTVYANCRDSTIFRQCFFSVAQWLSVREVKSKLLLTQIVIDTDTARMVQVNCI